MTRPLVYAEPLAVAPYEGGLFGAAQPVTGLDEHALFAGINFESLACYAAGFYPVGPLLSGGGGGTKDLPNGVAVGTATPFSIYAGILCGSVGYSAAESEARALRVLELAGQHAAETALWTGAGAESPHLNDTGYASTVVGTAASIVSVIGQLEDYIANRYNGRAILHMTRRTAIAADSHHLIRYDNGELRTVLGTRIVAGGGYDGTGPAAAAPGANKAWAYVTGAVGIARAEPKTPANMGEALDRSLNLVKLIAEQEYILPIDCAQPGAGLVDLTL